MTQREMFEASFGRPRNYFKLSPERQWEIDSELGILDWEGGDLTDEEEKRFQQHYIPINKNKSVFIEFGDGEQVTIKSTKMYVSFKIKGLGSFRVPKKKFTKAISELF